MKIVRPGLQLKTLLMQLALICLLASLVSASVIAPVNANETYPEMDWDELVPADYRVDAILDKYGDLSLIDDSDPRMLEIMKELEASFKAAPVIESLDGQQIKLPGFVVPLEGDGLKVSEFLLVPYFGACIHVPPPPANQTVYVTVPAADAEIREVFETVWVYGTLRAQSFDSDLATAGYTIEADRVTPYE